MVFYVHLFIFCWLGGGREGKVFVSFTKILCRSWMEPNKSLHILKLIRNINNTDGVEKTTTATTTR